jgi:LPXTG-site transpeptidase (sortase) family protein
MKYKNLRFHLMIGIFFVLAGILLSSQHFIQLWQKKNSQPFFTTISQPAVPAKATVSGTPSHISIPAVGIDLDVEPGYYDKTSQTWTLSLTQAMYATITPEANNAAGNTFIYGHNRTQVFYKLLKVQPGENATVTTSNHHRFVYKMVSRRDTKPTDSSLFNYQGPPILTLQTCSGFWYQNRSLFVFKLVEAA